MKFLSIDGLSYFYEKLKLLICPLLKDRHTHDNKDVLDGATASYTTEEKEKLDGIATGANKTTVDTALSDTSTNPVQNKTVATALDKTFQLRGQIGPNTDWNTITEAGCYKVHMAGWGGADTYHSPNSIDSTLYSFGLLFVMVTDVQSEYRISQIYIPHTQSPKILTRMHNSDSGFNTGWKEWSVPTCAPMSHTHDYLPLSGNAASATKLKNPRNINGVEFDGTKCITVPIENANIYNSISLDKPWYKIASATIDNAANVDTNVVFLVSKGLDNSCTGMLKLHVRTNSSKVFLNGYLTWIVADNTIKKENFVAVYTNDTTNGRVSIELWIKIQSQYDGYNIVKFTEHYRNAPSNIWNLHNGQNVGSASYTSGTGTLVSTMSTLQNPVENLADTGWQNLILGATGQVRYRKVGKLVEVDGQYKPANSGGGFNIGILPEGYRPSSFKAVATLPNPTGSAFFLIQVSTAGALTISGSSASAFTKGTTYDLHLMYFVD